MNKKITLVCSNYNSDLWIDDYLKCANNQIDKNFNIIFLDANSSDNSLNKIKNFNFDKNIGIEIIESKNRISLYSAWNICIKQTKTNYIMNYNTDDLIYDYATSVYNNKIFKNPDVDIFYGPCGIIKNRNINDYVSYHNWPEYSHAIMMQLCICGPFPLVKKQVFEDIGYFDETFECSGDYEMWARMSKNNKKFFKIPETIGSFYHRDDSISVRKKSKAQEEDQFIQTKYKI
jgi:glycosyltransferase involved in cell wall biosynthesis